jgi:hypothetical protein
MSFNFLNDGQDGKVQQFQPIDTFIDPVSKIRVSNPSNLIDTDFEYGLQPTKWETVEIINNTPAFFSKSGDTTIPDITGVTTNSGTREITVTTAFAHGLAVGVPIRVDGTKSITADGSYIINATPSGNTFTYLCRANQEDTISIFDLYTSIITGEFFQGSQISIDDAEGIITNSEGPISALTVKTKNKHGFGLRTPFYFLNLNSTIAQEFEAQNTASVSFDPSNSATAQAFDGSNTLLKTPIDLSNSATTDLDQANITNVNVVNKTITVSLTNDDWATLRVGDPLYYAVNAGSGYFQQNPRGVAFIKEVDGINTVQQTATFQISSVPNATELSLVSNMTGYFQIADQARTFAGNNIDADTQVGISVEVGDLIIFDGANAGYEGEPASPPNNTSTVIGWSGSTINLFTSEGELDYYVGAMLQYTTDGTSPDGLLDNATYFVTAFSPGAGSGIYTMSIANLPGSETLIPNGATATGSQQFSKIGVSVDKDIVHVKNANFVVGDMLEYVPPTDGSFDSDSVQTYYFVEKAYDEHNFQLNDNPFIPITATGGTTTDAFYDGRTYRTHTFTSVGTSSFDVESLGSEGEIEFLVVAAGGSGGNGSTTNANGGGGGGGILYKKKHVLDEAISYPVVVGTGGAGIGRGSNLNGNPGGNSSFGTFVANGGGGGGGRGGGSGENNEPGGSGGGTAWYNSNYADYSYNLGVTNQRSIEGAQSFGNDGAYTAITWTGGGGGGAAFEAQLTPTSGGRGQRGSNGVHGGWGGFGQPFDISGRVQFYAGGGGGAGNTSERSGDGFHGGGRGFGTISTYEYNEYDLTVVPTVTNGSSGGSLSLNGQANTGGGGGGSTYWSNNTSWGSRTSGIGGSGICIIRYPITPAPEFVAMEATGGTITDFVDKDGHWRMHKFNSSDTFTVTTPGSHGLEFLVVGGGGGGGNGGTTNGNGGGGGGGVIHCTSYPVTSAGTVTVTLGAGGNGIARGSDLNGVTGQNSAFGTFIARGGGGGGGRGSGGNIDAEQGGSGGGMGRYNNTNTNYSNQGLTATGQAGSIGPVVTASSFGNRGGRRVQNWTGAGGGGAGTFGMDGSYQTHPIRSGDGGLGYGCTIEGEQKYYAGGGGGGGNSSERGGDGWHGGGRGWGRTSYVDYNVFGANQSVDPRTLGSQNLNAIDGTGGGGGASSYWSNNTSWGNLASGAGGDGVVIVRYRLSPPEMFGYEGRMIASGGEEKDIYVSDGTNVTLYRTHMFKYTGSDAFTITDMGVLSTEVDYLVVAGGGGGGTDMGGGGGAGGVLLGTTVVQEGAYDILVGAGGIGASGYGGNPPPGSRGGNSQFGEILAFGGGGGSSGHYYNNNESSYTRGGEATSGGSGGGGSASYRSVALGRPPGAGTPGQGTSGGYGKYTGQYTAGGGGGAGGNSEVDFVTSTRAGNGGPGLYSDILGIGYYWGGGGGGAVNNDANKAGNGGIGGGAPGSRWEQQTEAPYRFGFEGYGGISMGTVPNVRNEYHQHGAMGGPNTGGGGGGGPHQGQGGGDGGSGIVVIRYPISTPRRIT